MWPIAPPKKNLAHLSFLRVCNCSPLPNPSQCPIRPATMGHTDTGRTDIMGTAFTVRHNQWNGHRSKKKEGTKEFSVPPTSVGPSLLYTDRKTVTSLTNLRERRYEKKYLFFPFWRNFTPDYSGNDRGGSSFFAWGNGRWDLRRLLLNLPPFLFSGIFFLVWMWQSQGRLDHPILRKHLRVWIYIIMEYTIDIICAKLRFSRNSTFFTQNSYAFFVIPLSIFLTLAIHWDLLELQSF